MSGASKKLMGTTAAGGGLETAIEDVFSTYLYTGNGSTSSSTSQTIVNGINLVDEGGIVWIKNRTSAADHWIISPEISPTGASDYYLISNSTAGRVGASDGVTSFNTDGFSLGYGYTTTNAANNNYASWTFRKAPRFFDVVTYTGNGLSSNNINHNLGLVPAFIIVKRTDSSSDWWVVARVDDDLYRNDLRLNQTSTGPNSGVFSAGSLGNTDIYFNPLSVAGDSTLTNASGAQYVAYLFAHDPLGPSGDGSDGLIACGSFNSGPTAAEVDINLGWEPQFVLWKLSSSTGPWAIYDTMRGIPTGGADPLLSANSSAAESVGSGDVIDVTSTGFKLTLTGWTGSIGPNEDLIYIAIRRGPMRAPESGTEVFSVQEGRDSGEPSFTSNFPVDLLMSQSVDGGNWNQVTRLQGKLRYLISNDTSAEIVDSDQNQFAMDIMDGIGRNKTVFAPSVAWMFRRAPGFFDVVAYTGNATAGRTVPHNLGVAPEMMIAKTRDAANYWVTYDAASGPTKFMILNQNNGTQTSIDHWNNTAPTSSVFTVGDGNYTNRNATQQIIYLFATLPGVSKVGSYTGNGSSQTIDCGFTTGARFILIKRTDSTGDWYVWDTARGIVTGNDPFLELNTTDAEVTSDDSIDPASSGFIVNQTGTTNVNVSSASYIFYAVS